MPAGLGHFLQLVDQSLYTKVKVKIKVKKVVRIYFFKYDMGMKNFYR